LLLAATERGVCSIRLGQDDALLLRDLQNEFARAVLLPNEKPVTNWAATVGFCGMQDPFLSRLPIATQCRIFETKLWALIAVHNSRI
jgi:AraC family transcriptional regulator, regulatory protein of adaptative response / methylated-DNA-[protein]-cysteine methyltransferase